MSMYETDGQSYTFPIRLYATALVCKYLQRIKILFGEEAMGGANIP